MTLAAETRLHTLRDLAMRKLEPVAMPNPGDDFQVNPTLELLAVEQQIVGTWRDPVRQRARVRKLTAEDLLALSLARKVVPPEATRIAPRVVAQAMRDAVKQGLLIPPRRMLRRDFATDQPDLAYVDTFTIQWHITHACELHCAHCYMADRKGPYVRREAGERILDSPHGRGLNHTCCTSVSGPIDACPLWKHRESLVLTEGNGKWPAACRSSSKVAVRTCLPVWCDREPVGVVELSFARQPAAPATRHTALVQHMLYEAGYHLTNRRAPEPRPPRPTRPVVETAPAPTAIGRYHVVESLSSHVHRVEYEADGCRRQAVLKTYPGLTDATVRQRFAREAQVLSDVQHVNVCRILDWGQRDNHPYLVTRLLHGAPLLQAVRHPRELGAATAEDLMRQALAGLSAMHETGLVHGHIRPDTLFCTWSGELKLLDLGIARRLLPRPEITVESAPYLSPEQLFNGAQIDRRSDLFSLGAVFYEMLTGHRPFEGPHLGEVMTRIAQSDLTPLQEWRSDLPPPILSLVHQMLAAAPDKRPRNAAAALGLLLPVGCEIL